MRSVGVAGTGTLALLLGCWPMPPPDPGRPPPPPEAPPTPPPEAAPARPAASAMKANAATATTAAPPSREPHLTWDAAARVIHCGGAELPVPADLSVYLRRNGGPEITVVPPGSPPGGALLALEIGPTEVHIDGDPELEEKILTLSERFQRLAETMLLSWGRLHVMASGRTAGDVKADLRVDDDDRILDAVYLDDKTPGSTWRLLLVHIEPCLITALESVRPDAAQRFHPMLQRMCAAQHARCGKITLPATFSGRLGD